eukprot:2595220-Rhodomonas_salina.2
MGIGRMVKSGWEIEGWWVSRLASRLQILESRGQGWREADLGAWSRSMVALLPPPRCHSGLVAAYASCLVAAYSRSVPDIALDDTLGQYRTSYSGLVAAYSGSEHAVRTRHRIGLYSRSVPNIA